MGEDDLSAALLAAQRGDEVGFATLWQTLQPAVLRYLRVVAGEAAEDIASETWLQVARDLAGFRGDVAGFRVWLFRIARNRGIDERRRAGRRLEDPDGGLPHEQPAVPDAEQEALEGFGTEWALRIIVSLPRDQAEAVMLRVVAGLDVARRPRCWASDEVRYGWRRCADCGGSPCTPRFLLNMRTGMPGRGCRGSAPSRCGRAGV